MALGSSSSYSLEEESDGGSATSPASPSLNCPGYKPYRSCRIRKKARRQPSWCACSSTSSSSSSRSSGKKLGMPPCQAVTPSLKTSHWIHLQPAQQCPRPNSLQSLRHLLKPPRQCPRPPQPAKPETPAEASQKAVQHPPSKATVVQARPKQVSATAPPQSQPKCA